jgi:hypothetical protein
LLDGRRLRGGCGWCGWCGFTGVGDDRQLAADGHGVVLVGDDLAQHPRRRRRDFGVDLIGGHLQQWLVDLDGIALLLEPAGDGALGDALTECGHLDGDGHRC